MGISQLAFACSPAHETNFSCEIPLARTLGSLSTDVFERRTSTGSGNFSSLTRVTPFLLKMLSCKC